MDSEEAQDGQPPNAAQRSNPAMSIIGAEDEEFENELNPMVDDQCSHFNSIELLKARPTHLLVFLQHIMLQFDCARVLCYLHADLFRQFSAKETKKHFVDFYNTFLDKGAFLRVPVPPHVAYELDRTRPDLLTEEVQKRFAQDIQNLLAPDVLRQLEDFKQKRMMGMTPNEQGLAEVETHRPTERIPLEMKEKAVAEALLDKMSEMHPVIGTDEEKFSSIFGAVVSYMKHLGVKTKATDSKKSRGFFRKKIPGMKKSEDSTKSKQRSGFPSILSETARWIGGSNVEIKTAKLENEGDKEKAIQERKGCSGPAPSGRIAAPEPAQASFPYRKSVPTLASGSLQGSEGSEGSGVSISVTSSPDSPHSELCLTSSRSDPQSVSESGDLSPAGIMGTLSVWEPQPASDNPPEDGPDKERRKPRLRLGRSESLCAERHRSLRGNSARGKQSRSRSDVDLQAAATATAAHPPSPFPQRCTLADSGATPSESSLPGLANSGPSPTQEELEPRLLELEQEPPKWREQASSDALSNLSKKEIKRQEVINELFATEMAHVCMLSVLQNVFFRPLEREMIMPLTELAAIFPSLDEIIDLHYAFYESLKKLRVEDNYIVRSVGATLLHMFNGAEGEWFQKLTARFCSHQTYALEQIKARQKKDPRFNTFILEAESKPQCKRLQLKDIIPREMQRLTKYPLLLENIAKNTEDSAEQASVQQAAECCRKILNHVNEEVKDMENLLSLKDYQRRLDTSGLKPSNELYAEYKSLDLTQRKMIYEGPLTWRVTKEKALDVQCVLLGDLLVLLQRQDDRMVLKCQSKSSGGVQEGKQMLSPIIKLESAFLREVATDNKAFYVIFTWDSGAQIYELVAHSVVERKNWTGLIKTEMDELKQTRSSSIERQRTSSLGTMGGALLYSPTTLQPPSSPTENGDLALKHSSDQDKDSLSEEKGGDLNHSLMDYFSANGFDLIAHNNSPQEKMANGALEEVASLKSIFAAGQSENSLPESENGGVAPDRLDQEAESCQSAEGAGQEGAVDGEQAGGEDGETKDREDGGPGGPLVLSPERVEEVQRRLLSLEQQLKQLQALEEEHHRLQGLLSKRALSGGSFQ
ncbi:rho guanine nucleotide exchange factor 1b isoform X3 [Anguilla anguilla]|uniref:rho guanine nucleotide exchange factor 1b isoform X3 n=1 Tax=Anguilla anguilla TaxID=7936 RepID=UPI0015A8794A|nr:rho guanine nucleotide exchange factor 1b isoform X3 [Anguilla anguilla]